MTGPLRAAVTTESVHTVPDLGLVGAVVETLYHAWQRAQSLSTLQVITRTLAGWDGTTVEEVHLALAELEHRGMAEMPGPDRWQRGEGPRRPTPLVTCQEPTCRRPLGHDYDHLPPQETVAETAISKDRP